VFDSDTLSSDLLGEREVDLNLQVPLSLARPPARLPARPLARAQAARPLALSFDYSLHANERTRDLMKGRGTVSCFLCPVSSLSGDVFNLACIPVTCTPWSRTYYT
jgi:hypothetical protein